MSHEDLIALTINPVFALAKDYIVEGLSVRLNSFENAIKSELKINTEPRVNFKPDAKDGKNAAGASGGLVKTNFDNYYERKLHEERQEMNAFNTKLLG